MIELPLVSVIIPTYNRAHLINKAIDSILSQSYKNIEIIIVDDCSSDDTENVIQKIKSPKVKYLRNRTNNGPSISRNIGINKAQGEFIAFLDSDDYWFPTKIEKQMDIMLKSDSSLNFVWCGMQLIDYETKNVFKKVNDNIDLKNNFTKGSFFITPSTVTVLAKKDALQKVGGFNSELKANEDTELAIKLLKIGDCAYISEILVEVVRNHEQLMGNKENYIQAKRIIIELHKDFLSNLILFGLCKHVSNFYIMQNKFEEAKKFLKKSIKFKPLDAKTISTLIILSISKRLVSKLFNKKYQGEVPLSSGLK